MSDYTKSTNFATKDNLSSGNPLKIVKGTEIDTEFNNIQTAIATKADLASPTFTGTVTIPTIPTLTVSGTSALTGVATLTANPILSAGTANGVTYLNGSKAVTSGSTFVFDGTNVGIGTSSPTGKLDVQGGRSYFASNSNAFGAYLRYNNSTNGVYLGSPSADAFQISSSAETAYLNINSSGNTTLAGTLTTSSRGIAKASMPAGSVLQVVNVQTQAIATSTVAIPTDDTIPQNTEGTELFTLAITPTSATSKLFIQVNALCGNTPPQWPTIALFQDSTANALAVNSTYQGTASAGNTLSLAYFMTAGTTSSTTFKIRFGLGSTGSMQINAFGSRVYGGVATTSMTIMEIAT